MGFSALKKLKNSPGRAPEAKVRGSNPLGPAKNLLIDQKIYSVKIIEWLFPFPSLSSYRQSEPAFFSYPPFSGSIFRKNRVGEKK
ncbi:hypothetical protein [Candidatus Methylomicrobium oryzae]|uniref:hypothetical protein n=1 Tax=Candidatus Methylomicrobium oryzae TaxID=2802053 RepID=UPI001921993D|nr:hypothetical protein [Methylomicrobium sp. RS1]MBL1264309.1 hypothetical protein [Methylomicrobium sp. RS1]